MDNKFKTAWLFYMAAIFFAPLAFGATEEWSFFIVFSLTGLSFVFFQLYSWGNKEKIYKVPGSFIFAIGLLYLVFQIMPLPSFLMKILSPEAFNIRSNLYESGLHGSYYISMNLNGGFKSISFLVLFYLVYYLGVQFFANYRILKKTVVYVSLFAGFLAISTILQSLFTTDTALWFRYVEHHSMVFGPYVNHNHYAGLMEMIMPLVLSLYLIYKPSFIDKSLREQFIGFFERESAYIYITFGFFTVIIILSVFMSLSRAGIFSMCLSLIVFILLLKSAGKKGNTGGSFVFFTLFATIAVWWYGWNNIDERFGQTLTQIEGGGLSRLNFWKDTIAIIKDFVLTGTGAGSFEQVYPLYKSFVSERLIGHAHNDYLELISDTGLIGFVLAAVFFIILIYNSFTALKKRKEKFAVIGSCAAFSCLFAIAIHSIADFNMQIPANGLIFFFVCSLFVSFSHTRFRKNLQPSFLKQSKKISSMVNIFIFTLIWLPVWTYCGGSAYARINSFNLPTKKITPASDFAELELYTESAKKAFKFNPLDAEFAAAVGDSFFFRNNLKKSIKMYERSLVLRPVSADILQKCGLALYYSGEKGNGEKLLKLGVDFNKNDISVYSRLAAFYFDSGKKEMGIKTVKKGILIDPSKSSEFFSMLWSAELNFTEMERALPDISEAYYRFSSFVSAFTYKQSGDYNLNILEKALVLASEEKNPNPGIYTRLAGAYLRNNNSEKAFEVVSSALQKCPDNAQVLYYAGIVYESLSLNSKAVDYYKQALLISPDMKAAMNRLDNLIGKNDIF